MRISRALLARIVSEAADAPGREVCGLLFGDDACIESAQATANISSEPDHSFEVDPRALFAAMRAERAGGPRLIGHYHSHPNGVAAPSARDAAAARPGSLWLIVAGVEAAAWMAREGGFLPVRLAVV